MNTGLRRTIIRVYCRHIVNAGILSAVQKLEVDKNSFNGENLTLMNLSACKKAQTHLWKALITYRTKREAVVEDVKIGLLHKATLFGIFVYLLFSIFTNHAYMVKEAPAVSTNSWAGAGPTMRRLAAYRNGSLDAPWYCNNSATNYVYSDSFTYLNNLCDFNAVMGEIYNEGGTATSFLTYYQDSALGDDGTDMNAFIPDIELVTLYFSHAFTSSLGVEGANVRTTIRSNDGTQKKTFEEGEAIAVQLQELLLMSNLHLDDRHANGGGEEPTGNLKWPLWRMTGVSIILEMEYKNFREESPFDFSGELIITVGHVENVWTNRGRQIHFKWENGNWNRYKRYTQVLSVAFRPSGQVGIANAFEAIMNIGVSVAIFGVSKMIVDTVGTWVLKEFSEKKRFTNRDWRTFQHTAAAIDKLHQRKRVKPQNNGDNVKPRKGNKRKVSTMVNLADSRRDMSSTTDADPKKHTT